MRKPTIGHGEGKTDEIRDVWRDTREIRAVASESRTPEKVVGRIAPREEREEPQIYQEEDAWISPFFSDGVARHKPRQA